MTREEMIEQIENTILLIKQNGKDWWDERDIPVLEEAIKAMKMEPCEDVVSRQAALDTVDTLRIVIANNLPELIYKSSVLKLLHDLPSVQPGQKIVRCKDCKYVWKEDGWDNLYCNRVKVSGSFAVERDGYCAWAKMEEGE